MTDIPDEAVQALARMINPDAWESYDLLTKPYAAEYREYIVRRSLAQATEYLTAAAPIIRADVRRRVAEEIRAAAWPTDKADTEGLDFGYALGRNAGLDIAAQIAERNGE